MEKDTLKKCPFCGEQPTLLNDPSGRYWILCPFCGVTTTYSFDSPHVIKKWNKRGGSEE